MLICYHGTNEKNAQSILKTGFRPWTWFTAHLENALGFGGFHIFEVVFDEDSEPPWQFMIKEHKPPESIVCYEVYARYIKFENNELQKAIFESNAK